MMQPYKYNQLVVEVGVKVKVYFYGPDIPGSSSDFTVIIPEYWSSLFHSLISVGRIQRTFYRWRHLHSVFFFVPPGTHYC